MEERAGRIIATRVAGSDATGFTILESDQSAVFFPTTGGPADAAVQRAEPSAQPAGLYSREELEQLYPQWRETDDGATLGEAARLVASARRDLVEATNHLSRDPSAAVSLLVMAEGALFRSLAKASASETLYSAISFCAWAVRGGTTQEMSIAMLDRMVAALGDIERRPFMSVRKLGEIVEQLEDVGWAGESPFAAAFRQGLEEPLPLDLAAPD